MKRILIYLSYLFVVSLFVACEREEDKATVIENPRTNWLTPLSEESFVLTMDQASDVFHVFQWTEPYYGFDASITYIVQVDIKGNNFASPVNLATVNRNRYASITVGDFNKVMLDKELEPETAVDLEFRVACVVNPLVDTLYSNIQEATVTPYATSFPPIYMCGAATGGWDWTKGVEVRSSAPSIYQTIAYFINNETFRFFKQADWGPVSYNYPYFDSGVVSDSLENALDGDQNFKFLAPTGYYNITVNMKTKTVSLQAVAEPKMFMTGAAVGGWDWTTNYVQMTWKSNGIFEATTEFINGEAFRFFAQADWGPTSYNYPYFSGGTVDPLFENANDGDKNFKFVGTTGVYKITLNMLDLIITMKAQ